MQGIARLYASTETWPSGRRRSPAKGVGPEGSRGFESLRLRHFTANPLILNDTGFREGRNPRPGTVYWYSGARMATTPRLVTRGRTFYFRASVPQDLWDVAGRKEVKISLRTTERSLAQLRCRVFSNHVDLVVKETRRMARGQDATIDQAIRDYFREALDWGQEFADIFAPDAEVDVDDCISTLETRLSDHRRRLAVRNFPSDVQADAEALVGAIPPEQLASRYQALQRAHAGLMRAKIEADRLLITKLNGDYSQTAIADPLFAGVEPRLDETIPSHVISHPQAPTQALSTAPSLDALA